MATAEYPTTIRGGCICGSVRYSLTFPPSHDWKKSCSTCQCEQCRKNNGSLITWLHEVPVSSVEFTTPATLSRYHTTAGNQRGFCASCGSWLFHCSEKPDVMFLTVGTFDKDAIKRWGWQFSYSEMHLWAEDAIEGITDHFPGEKWKYHSEGEGAERIG